jgi:WD40 repeat protein
MDAATGQPVGRPLSGHTQMVYAVATGPAGDREVIVSGGRDGTVRIWYAATGQPVGQQHFPDLSYPWPWAAIALPRRRVMT